MSSHLFFQDKEKMRTYNENIQTRRGSSVGRAAKVVLIKAQTAIIY